MNNIDFFAYVNEFKAAGLYQPVEVGIAQLNEFEEIELITVDLTGLKFTENDKRLNIKLSAHHGIEPIYNVKTKFHYKVSVENFDDLFSLLFKKETVRTFAVEGKHQFDSVKNILTGAETEFTLLDINDLGKTTPMKDFDKLLHQSASSNLKRAPKFHHDFHRPGCEEKCAGKVAWAYARALDTLIEFASSYQEVYDASFKRVKIR